VYGQQWYLDNHGLRRVLESKEGAQYPGRLFQAVSRELALVIASCNERKMKGSRKKIAQEN
jgi:hypothetical protein